MTDQAPIIEQSDIDDSGKIAEILGDAFQNDPCMNFVVPLPALYASFYRLLAEELYFPRGLVFTDRERGAAAMWLPPGADRDLRMSLRQIRLILRLVFKRGLGVLPKLQQAQTVMDENHPEAPHYYLQAIGVRRGYQGKGLGSALLKHMTMRVDAENMPCYLESSSPANVPLYQRHGFEITGETPIAEGGPPLVFMWREPRP